MQKIKVSTYFDITPTGIVHTFRPSMLPIKKKDFTITNDIEWYFRRRQQANWETIFQIVMMRIQPVSITSPVMEEVDGKKVWSFEFVNELELTYVSPKSTDPLHVLKEDTEGVPMIPELEASEQLEPFLRVDENIFIELLDD